MKKREQECAASSVHNFDKPLLGIIHGASVVVPQDSPSADLLYTFVDVHSLSATGALIESSREIGLNSLLDFMAYDFSKKKWDLHAAQVASVEEHTTHGQYLVELEYLFESHSPGSTGDVPAEAMKRQPSDLRFLTNTDLLECLPHRAFLALINCLAKKRLAAGERLIHQGEPGTALYLIQKGTCSVKVEKDGVFQHIAYLGEGEVAGEMAVLTGEPHAFHVDAETEITVWELKSQQFETISSEHHDLRIFLTEMVAQRLESWPHAADRIIGKYLIKHKIGRGGWGIVYRGIHTVLHMPVAIKMLKHDMAMEPLFLNNFRSEAKTIAQLSHSNIVRVYDIEELYRTVFIVMEYLEGESLENLLKNTGPLSFPRALNFLVQICQGLGYAHQKGIIHRDIKPGNIFVEPGDHIKILDFGLACSQGNEDLSLAGTVQYAPPEQICGTAVAPTADIYALGISAFEMLTGRRPYPESDLAVLMDLHCEQDIPDPAKLVPGLPEELRNFILKACERSPEDRFRNTEEALELLRPLEEKMIITDDQESRKRQRLKTLFLFCPDGQQIPIDQLIEEFGTRAKDLGAILKMVEFKDL